MYNKVIMMGRICSDPELKTTPNGTNVCSFRIAVGRRFQQKGEKSGNASAADTVPAAPQAAQNASSEAPAADFSGVGSDPYPF